MGSEGIDIIILPLERREKRALARFGECVSIISIIKKQCKL